MTGGPMEDPRTGGPVGPQRRGMRGKGSARVRSPQHAVSTFERQTPSVNDATTGSGLKRIVTTVRDYLPRGNTLDDEAFKTRHRFLCWVLALHLPALVAFGVFRGYGLAHSALEVAAPATLLLFGQLARNRRGGALFLTPGLVF